MMNTFVVATPLFDSKISVCAYHLCSRNPERLFGALEDYWKMSDALRSPDLDLLDKVGIEPFAVDKKLIIELNEYQLLTDVPTETGLPPDKLICLLHGSARFDEASLAKCQTLKELGYALAMHITGPNDEKLPLMALSDYIILDFKGQPFDTLIKTVTRNVRRKKVVISDIPDMDSFDRIGSFTNVLYAGHFYSQPITKGVSDISPLKINMLRLMKQINEEDFDLTQIASTVGRDAALSISLLRFINAIASGSRKIDSIRGAVAILGQKEVRRWATVAMAVALAEDRPGEITKLSLVRAKFAENLATAYELGIFAPRLFMAGLFSLLDVILQKPMDRAIKEIAVDSMVHAALVERTGELYEVLDLIYAYERADWDHVSINMVRNNVSSEAISEAFLDALLWYKQLLDSIDEQ